MSSKKTRGLVGASPWLPCTLVGRTHEDPTVTCGLAACLMSPPFLLLYPSCLFTLCPKSSRGVDGFCSSDLLQPCQLSSPMS